MNYTTREVTHVLERCLTVCNLLRRILMCPTRLIVFRPTKSTRERMRERVKSLGAYLQKVQQKTEAGC